MADNDENVTFPFRDMVEEDMEDIINCSVSGEQLVNECSKYEHFNFKNFEPIEYMQ